MSEAAWLAVTGFQRYSGPAVSHPPSSQPQPNLERGATLLYTSDRKGSCLAAVQIEVLAGLLEIG